MPVRAANAQGILYSTDTTGTNARPSNVTISPSTAGTNIATGSIIITNVTASAIVKVDASKRSLAAVAGTDYSLPLNLLTDNVVVWTGASATRTWTFSLSGANDPVLTLGNDSVSLTGALTVAPALSGTGLTVTGGAASDPLVYIGNAGVSSNYSIQLGNSAGSLEIGIAGVAGFGFPTALPGDAGISTPVGNALRLGIDTNLMVTLFSSNRLTIMTNTMRVGRALTPWPRTNNTVDMVWKKNPQVFEFAGAGAGEWTSIQVNSGTASTAAVDGGLDLGQFILSTGTLTNGMAGYRLATTAVRFSTNGPVAVHWRFLSPPALSTDADAYEYYVGFGDATTDAAPTDGAYIFYTHTVNGGAWLGRTVNNNSVTAASGGGSVTFVESTWYNIIVEGSSDLVNFWVSNNDGATWTWIGSSAANIPSAMGRETGVQAYIRKVAGSVGTTARTSTLGMCSIYSHTD